MTTTLGELLPYAARHYGDRTALIVGGKTFNYRELDDLSNSVANALMAAKVRPGDRVTLDGPNCWEWLVAYYGIAKVGAVLNPINEMLTQEEVRFVIEDTGARAVIASREKGECLLDLKGRTDLSEVILWGEPLVPGALSLDSCFREGKSHFNVVPRRTDDLASICYTSGTTGYPKGAVHDHRAAMRAIIGTALMAARTSNDRFVNALPLAHVYGSCVFNATFMCGGCLIMLPRFDETAILHAISEHKATMLDGVPTIYYYLLGHKNFEKYDLSSLNRCWVGGQTLPVAKSLEFAERVGCPVHEVWGMTELAGPASANPAIGLSKAGTIGFAFPGNEMRIVDAHDPKIVLSPGRRGELMFRGPMVMKGYYGNGQATTEALESDGWLHTGDIATVDEDGYFTIVDRKKDMILTAGFNIYPAELERVLCMHPAVALAAVAGVPDEAKGELAKAYVVRKRDAHVTKHSLVQHCREHLAAYKVPRAVQFVEDVPKTSTGKVMRRGLIDIDDGTRSL